ncbi:MAG TPA: YccF domain-containing protein, partial [candidate division Zixibacteria bacterium]|nr:YccF domain-containing protein [candidate division Zixibacteria bacterium]
RQVPFLLRVIWFFFLGWELAGVWILAAWAFNITIIGLPIGIWMLDRVPQVLTLKSRSGDWVVDLKDGQSQFKPRDQFSWLIRLPYFILVGWWMSLLWAAFAWLICATIILLPIGVVMLHALPAVTTLQRG